MLICSRIYFSVFRFIKSTAKIYKKQSYDSCQLAWIWTCVNDCCHFFAFSSTGDIDILYAHRTHPIHVCTWGRVNPPIFVAHMIRSASNEIEHFGWFVVFFFRLSMRCAAQSEIIRQQLRIHIRLQSNEQKTIIIIFYHNEKFDILYGWWSHTPDHSYRFLMHLFIEWKTGRKGARESEKGREWVWTRTQKE